MNKQLLARLEALEAKARQRKVNKPADPFPFGRLWLHCIGRSRAPRGSLLDGYAKAACYRGGAEALWRAAYSGPKLFARKHAGLDGDAAEVRAAVIQEFLVEELAWQALEAVERAGGIEGRPLVDSGLPLRLSECRPMRPGR